MSDAAKQYLQLLKNRETRAIVDNYLLDIYTRRSKEMVHLRDITEMYRLQGALTLIEQLRAIGDTDQ